MFSRRQFLKKMGTATVLMSSGIPIIKKMQTQKPPNIIFIMSDDHAAHAISAYGSRINQTPHIDRLAEEGVRFDNCFCTNSICAPSRAVILTGKYSHLNGVMVNKNHFDGRQQTFPKLLRQAGYVTALIGKWHLNGNPTGFDYWNILPGQGSYNNPEMIENGTHTDHKGYVTDIITDQALDWLKTCSTAKPFCLLIHHKATHANWIPDTKHADLYSDQKIPTPDTFDDNYATRSDQIKNHRLKVGINQWQLHYEKRLGEIPIGMGEQETRQWVYQRYIKDYLRCIASVDENIGRVLDYLDNAGLSENTLIFYTSDQGFFLGDHGLYDKRFMYEPSLRMPLIIRYPKEIKEHTVAKAMVLNLDFASTILDFAGVPIPKEMQGESFRRIAGGEKPDSWQTMMYYRFYESAFGVGPIEGIRTQRYKLIHYLYGDMGWELYDFDHDPNELQNLYDNADKGQLIEDLRTGMNHLRKKYAFPDDL